MQISVVMPCYNAELYLSRSLDSILAQTIPVVEIVVVDDGSRDCSAQIIASYQRRLGPEKIRLVSQANSGPSAARNRGIREATCPWIAFLDSDDWWAEEKLAKQADAIRLEPEAVICYTSMWYVAPDGSMVLSKATPPDKLWPILRYVNRITPSTVLARRDVLLGANGFDTRLKTAEDWDLWVRLGQQTKYAVVMEPVTYYHVTPGSLSQGTDENLKNLMAILDKSLLNGLTGWNRAFWRRRILCAEYYRAFKSGRDAGDGRILQFLIESLMQWPSPFFLPRRYVALLHTLTRGYK